MKVDPKFFGFLLFLIAQTGSAIWWACGISAEVERLAGIQGTAIPALEAEAKQCGIEIHNLKKTHRGSREGRRGRQGCGCDGLSAGEN